LNSSNTGTGFESVSLPRERRIPMLGLTCLIFFTTCGGAFGLEPLIGAVGPGWAVILIVVTPFLWSLPIALMVAELTTLMPSEGGYYVWIRDTFGPFWAVQQACWTISCSVVWLAMFPVLFVSYLAFLVPMIAPSANSSHSGMAGVMRWLIALLVIAFGMLLNLRGARDVGRSAKVSAYIVLGAFAVLLLTWLKHGPLLGSVADIVGRDLASRHKGILLLGLSYLVFNFSAWENASTYAGEVDHPQHNYPRALALALLTMVLCYLFPVIAGVTVTSEPTIWSADAGWPVIAHLIGGRWLGDIVASAGLVSTWGLFNAQLLYVSRLPYVLACDGWLPRVLASVSTDTAVPRAAIFIIGAIAALFAALSFGSLAVIQCVLYSAALTLEFLALIVLRIRCPNAFRSFRVPGGWFGMTYVCVTPFAFAALVLFSTLREWQLFPGQLSVVSGVVGTGIVLYFIRRNRANALNGPRVQLAPDEAAHSVK
jgi:amino acid transporter